MAEYTKVFDNPYPNGWEDLPSENTPITANALQEHTDAIENIEQYLEDNPIEQGGADVQWNQIQTDGTKIAEVTIDGEITEVFAPNGGSGGGQVIYDGEEHIIGSYFGHTLYSKLIKINALPSSATTQSYPHHIANIDHIMAFYSFHHFAGESVANGTNLSFSGTSMYASGCFNVTVDRTNVNVAVGQNRNNVSCEVIINYTKVES